MKHYCTVNLGKGLARMAAGLTIAAAWIALHAVGLADVFQVSNAAQIAAVMQSRPPAGSTLIMANGIWRDEVIAFEGDGTPERPITLRAQTPGQVILTGRSRLMMSGSYLVASDLYFKEGALVPGPGELLSVVTFRSTPSRVAHRCRLTNSAIENYNPPEIATRYFWVSLYGTYNRVDHCTFKGKTNIGSVLTVVRGPAPGGPQYHQIHNNYFADRPALPGINGVDIITIGNSGESMTDSFTTVRSNVFHRCDGEIEIISSKSGRNVFRNNTFLDSIGTLTLRHGNRNWVEGNFFFGNYLSRTGGVRVIGENHVIINNYFWGISGGSDTWRAALTLSDGVENPALNEHFQVKNATIAFNTFVDNEQNIIIGGGRENLARLYPGRTLLPPLNSTMANNIVVKTPDAPYPSDIHCLIHVVHEPINMTYEGNIMFGDCLGLSTAPNGIAMIDPQLVWSADGLYRPDAGSPAIDNAVGDYPRVTLDMDGQPRADGFKDVGADEVSEAPITRRPLMPQDVGVNWMLQR